MFGLNLTSENLKRWLEAAGRKLQAIGRELVPRPQPPRNDAASYAGLSIEPDGFARQLADLRTSLDSANDSANASANEASPKALQQNIAE
jgi:hypothetical protein